MSLGERIVLSAWIATREHLKTAAAEQRAAVPATAANRFRRFDVDVPEPMSSVVVLEPDEACDDTDSDFREGAD